MTGSEFQDHHGLFTTHNADRVHVFLILTHHAWLSKYLRDDDAPNPDVFHDLLTELNAFS